MNKIMVLSPHLDDAALSCGEYIKKLNKAGNKVKVLTIFSAYPKNEKLTVLARKCCAEWDLPDDAVKKRQEEDKKSMNELGVEFLYLPMYECLYRKYENGEHKYLEEFSEIYHQKYEKEEDTIEELKEHLKRVFKENNIDTVISPLGIGRHIDHLVTRWAVEKVKEEVGFKLEYYEEVPYVGFGRDKTWEKDLASGLQSRFIKITEEEWDSKMKSVECYSSQIIMLWGSREEEKRQYEGTSHRQSEKWRSIRIWE